MGRDYWPWCSSAPTTNANNSNSTSSSSSSSSAGGCISSLLHFLDFRFPHLYPDHHFNHEHQQPITLVQRKGVEAPRNSLESEDDDEIASPSCKQDHNLNIPKVIDRIKTSRVDKRPTTATTPSDCSSDNSSSSPAAKTPSLVARLMGLDPVPHCDSPSSKSSSAASVKPFHIGGRTTKTSHRNSFEGTRSLPETPRISLARRSVDSDCYHHRFSLQINKENDNNVSGDNKSPSFYARQTVSQVKDRVDNRLSVQIRKENVPAANGGGENRSPRYYARQIYSQVKDRVGRSKTVLAPLTDVTNTRPKNPDHHQKTKRSTRHGCTMMKIRNTTRLQVQNVIKEEEAEQPPPPPPRQAKKCKTASASTIPDNIFKIITTSDILRNKQEEPFIRPATAAGSNILQDKTNGKKITPLSPQLINTVSVVPIPVKKDPSPPDIKIPQKQVILPDTQKSKRRSSFSQLPSTSSQGYKQEATQKHAPRNGYYNDNRYDVTNGGRELAAENEYVNSILRRIGISKDRPVSSTRWFSPAHPLDPSIFFYLEHFSAVRTAGLDRRSNRRLLFQLVDEILVEILKPYLRMKPWISLITAEMNGAQLGETLVAKIRRFPRADCRVLEDIDALVEMDYLAVGTTTAYEEEGEGIVAEIEKDIVDTLMVETTAYLLWGVRVQVRVRDRNGVVWADSEIWESRGMGAVHVTRGGPV